MNNSSHSQAPLFKQGFLYGLIVGFILATGLSFLSSSLFKTAPIASINPNPKNTSITQSPQMIKPTPVAKENMRVSADKRKIEPSYQAKQPNHSSLSHQQQLQRLLEAKAYSDLNDYARNLIHHHNLNLAWQFLIQAELNQGFYLNAINIAAEHINFSIENNERENAIRQALTTLATIDQQERSKGNTFQLIELYEHSLDLLSPWLSHSDDLQLTLAKLYLATGDENAASTTLLNIQQHQTTSPNTATEVKALLKQITQNSFAIQRIPLIKQGKHYTASLQLTDHTTVNLLLDTGASISTLNQPVFNNLSGQLNFTALRDIQVNTAGGIQTGKLISLPQVSLADINLEDLQFIVLNMHSERFDGLLGMNILERFEFTIDQHQQELVLSKPL